MKRPLVCLALVAASGTTSLGVLLTACGSSTKRLSSDAGDAGTLVRRLAPPRGQDARFARVRALDCVRSLRDIYRASLLAERTSGSELILRLTSAMADAPFVVEGVDIAGHRWQTSDQGRGW